MKELAVLWCRQKECPKIMVDPRGGYRSSGSRSHRALRSFRARLGTDTGARLAAARDAQIAALGGFQAGVLSIASTPLRRRQAHPPPRFARAIQAVPDIPGKLERLGGGVAADVDDLPHFVRPEDDDVVLEAAVA